MTLAVTYTNSRGTHAPLARHQCAVGGWRLSAWKRQPLFLMTSSGVYRQNQLSANFNSKLSRAVSLTGSYTFNRARSNTDGLATFPANPYDYAGEYEQPHRRSSSGERERHH